MAHVDLTDAQEELLQAITRKWEAADAGHRRHREQWDRLDALYHARRELLGAHAGASPRDRDSVVDEARKAFGEELLIPYAFSVIETVLPRMLSNRPKMLWTPRNPASEENVENVALICDAQQHKANYELKLQTTARSGLIYGLGVQKVFWRHETAMRKVLRPTVIEEPGKPSHAVRTEQRVLWDDPDVEDVSIYDFLWDPYGDCMANVGYVFHRTWRSTSYVLDKVKSGAWGEVPLDAECLQGGGGKDRYTQLWKPRWSASGQDVDLKEPVHEVWEFHDGQRVITVVDRKWPVAQADNPAWHGQLPFHIYRPTEILHSFVGKGEVEPIEDLQRELNWLRTDRRWNAAMVMHRAHFYMDGAIDPEEVKIGPGSLIPVANTGIPLNEILHPVTVGDIPNSGYQEELALQQDIERVSGISDSVSGGGTGAEQTATGVQLVQAAAGMRIQNKTRRVELELIKPEAEQWLALNQQRITEARYVAVPETPLPQPGSAERRWSWRKIGPEQLAGEFDVEPDGGSTAPENVPQQRADAQMLMGMAAAPGVDQRKLMLVVFEKLGIKAPEKLMAPDVHVPPQTLDLIAQALLEHLGEMGMDPAEATPMVNELIGGALNMALDQEEQQAGGGGPPSSDPPQQPERMAA